MIVYRFVNEHLWEIVDEKTGKVLAWVSQDDEWKWVVEVKDGKEVLGSFDAPSMAVRAYAPNAKLVMPRREAA